jgi:hypothetical protein
MSDMAGEIAGLILILFFGGGILLAVNAALNGGDVSGVTSLISTFSVPVVILAIIAFFAIAILESL